MEVFFVLWRHGTNLRKTWITTENQCAKRYEIITTPGEFREEMLWLVGLRCMCVYDGIKSAIHSRATHVSYMNVENLKIFLYPFWTMSSNKQCNACPKFWSKKKQNSRSIVELSFIYKNTWLLPKMGGFHPFRWRFECNMKFKWPWNEALYFLWINLHIEHARSKRHSSSSGFSYCTPYISACLGDNAIWMLHQHISCASKFR